MSTPIFRHQHRFLFVYTRILSQHLRVFSFDWKYCCFHHRSRHHGKDGNTHRITAVNRDAQTFITKGDNNNEADGSPVLYGNVVGKVIFSVPYVGYALMYLTTIQGKLTVGAILLIFIILLFLWDDGGGKKNKQVDGQNDKHGDIV